MEKFIGFLTTYYLSKQSVESDREKFQLSTTSRQQSIMSSQRTVATQTGIDEPIDIVLHSSYKITKTSRSKMMQTPKFWPTDNSTFAIVPQKKKVHLWKDYLQEMKKKTDSK